MPVAPAVIEFGEFRLDRISRSLFRNSEPVKLTAKPFELLEFLVTNDARVFSKEELLQRVWGGLRDPNVVEQTIRQVRLVLEADLKKPHYIVTITGAGYRFDAPLFFSEPEPLSGSELKSDLPMSAREPVDAHAAPPSAKGGEPVAIEHHHALTASGSADGKKRRSWALTVMCLTLLGLGIFLYATAPGEPAACEVSVNTLIVKDGQGQEVWRREFPERLNRARYAIELRFCEYTDLDGDGTADVLFSFKREAYLLDGDTLYGFITRSRMLRRLRPNPARTLTFKPGASLVVGPNSDATIARPYDEYIPPYAITGVFARRTWNSTARIVVSSALNEAPDQVAVLDSSLKRTGEYWHAGQLRYGQFARYKGHDRIFLAGVNNGYHSATLVAFDPNNVKGTTDLNAALPDRAPLFSILATGTRGHLSPLSVGTETCRVLFERTCLAKAKPYREPYNRVIDLNVTDDRIIVRVAEGEREATPENVVYEMDRHLNLIEADPNTKFRQRHFELERAGLLDHAFSMQELKPLIHVLPGCEFVEKEQ